jgi:predicted nucleotidyltransferase
MCYVHCVMASIVQRLLDKKLIKPPKFLPSNVHYETMMGSIAYGVSNDSSDVDVYGFCIPPKDMIFPHLAGEIPGFGRQLKRFDQYQQHHVTDPDDGKEYDLSIYNIVKFFSLCMDNNPNMLDSLFTPERCVLHCSAIGEMVRSNRTMFLHKGCWHKYKGYAHSQLHKMRGQKREGKRKELFDKHGFDVKFAYHVVRLMYEAEMILAEKDLDLTRHREHLKAIRRGEMPQEEIFDWYQEKEKALERLYEASDLPWGPDEEKIKALLLSCLEHHYGSLDKAVITESKLEIALREIRDIANSV